MDRRGAYFALYHDVLLSVAGVLSVACFITQSTAILVALLGLVIWLAISEIFAHKLFKIPRRLIGFSLNTIFILFFVFLDTALAMAIPNPGAVLLKPAIAVAITLITMNFMLMMLKDAVKLRIVK